MTGPALSAPVQTGTPPSSGPKPRVVSPAYWRYLNDQVEDIRAQGGGDADVQQFIDMEREHPFAMLPPLGDEPIDAPSHLRGVSMALIRGATFGFGDEAVGALYGKLSGIGARAGIDQYRQEYEAWAKDNGGKAFTAELLGGVLSGGLGGIAAKGALRTAMRGAASGAVAGVGNAEGTLGERTSAGLLGGALSGAFSLGVSGVGAVARPIARPLVQRLLTKTETVDGLKKSTPTAIARLVGITPEARARELLARTLREDGLTPEEVVSRAAALRAAGVPATILEVGGPATIALAQAVAKTRSPLKTKLFEELKGRQTEQGERLIGGLVAQIARRNKLGLANAYDVEDLLHSHALKVSQEDYAKAFEEVVELTPRLRRLLKHPKIAQAYAIGMKLAKTEDLAGTGHGLKITPLVKQEPTELTAMVSAGIPRDKAMQALGLTAKDIETTEVPVRGIDYLKRGLDVIIKRGTTGEKPTLDRQGAKALLAIRDEIVREARGQSTAYGRALDLYSGPIQAREALRRGKKFLRKAPEEILRDMKKLSPNDRDFYRMGAVQALYEKVSDAPETSNFAARFFGGSLFTEKTASNKRSRQLLALFPDAPDAAQEFLRRVTGEARVSFTTKGVARLPKAVGVEASEQATEGGVIQARNSMGIALIGAARQAVTRLRSQLSEDESDELTHLFSKGLSDPDEFTALADGLFHVFDRLDRGSKLRTRLVTSTGQIGGRIAGNETR